MNKTDTGLRTTTGTGCKKWLSVADVAREFGFSRSKQERMRAEGLRYAKVGRQVRYRREDVETFLENCIVREGR